MEWKKGLCGICPAGCWVEIAVSKGKMVDIRPDDSHSLGTICRLGQHAVEIVSELACKNTGCNGSDSDLFLMHGIRYIKHENV